MRIFYQGFIDATQTHSEMIRKSVFTLGYGATPGAIVTKLSYEFATCLGDTLIIVLSNLSFNTK